ncbi:electron transfer flavoprotein subunit alpha/FixB family protein [Azohydromonas australica]|uniref:electron transfer flavoprotein subunit alpha/FixB family protein n=1 Tax=Azohydromonas australica TaxID=364039 RepID=UPI0004064F97|nr:electron transfer flavoprotein subunit alpha/FixB family protein [Azohydromonas australica]
MKALVIAVHDAYQLDATTARLVTAATRLTPDIDVLVMGADGAAVAQQAAQLAGVRTVLRADAHHLASPNAETLARQIGALADGYRFIVAAHGMAARAALPRLAAQREATFLADVTAIESPELFVRPMYAGSVLAKVQVPSGQVLLTVRPAAFEPCATGANATVTDVAAATPDTRTVLIGRDAPTSNRPDLTRAGVVVAAGRGIGSAEHMKLIDALADKLGGAVGASRAAVDAGFAPNAIQVGQTGKTVAPDVYFAFGISGAIQHLAGIKDARVIVAVNKDADAPIFSVADLGLVGDLFEVLPALTRALPQLRSAA